jgi:hypothetical protein
MASPGRSPCPGRPWRLKRLGTGRGALTALGGLLEAAAAADNETSSVGAVTPASLVASLQPGTRTLGLWLYAVSPSAQRRWVHPPQIGGQPRRLPSTAVDLHYLLIARAGDALAQQKLLGWRIRVLEDHASLPPPPPRTSRGCSPSTSVRGRARSSWQSRTRH